MQTASLVSLASQYDDIRIAQLLLGGSMGILGPMLIVLVCLWLGRGDRSPWYIKAGLVIVFVVLVIIMLGGI